MVYFRVMSDNGDNGVNGVMRDNNLGRRLVAFREAARLTHTEVAARAGLHPNTVSNAERGAHPPTVATLEALARVFDVTVSELFVDSTEEDD